MERHLDDAVTQVGRSLLGFLIAHKLNADHQTAAANFADDFVPLGPVCRLPLDELAHASGVGHVTSFN